jgi:hypothetical protein
MMAARIVFDKRTLRKKFGAAFVGAIEHYHARGCFLDELAKEMDGDPAPTSSGEPVQVGAAAGRIRGATPGVHGAGCPARCSRQQPVAAVLVDRKSSRDCREPLS